MTSSSPSSGSRGRFPTTRWTLILSARESPERRRAALEELLNVYWKPLYFYARRKGLSVEAAEDCVQGFCLHLLESDFLPRLDPEKGRLRSYLRTSLNHYLSHLRERETAEKRGGGVRPIPLDTKVAERMLTTSSTAPEDAFDRQWAIEVMERALGRLRMEYEEGRRRGEVDVVLRFFGLSKDIPSYAEGAAASGSTIPQFKASLHRARRRFREIVRDEIVQTVDDPKHVDREMAELVELLRR